MTPMGAGQSVLKRGRLEGAVVVVRRVAASLLLLTVFAGCFASIGENLGDGMVKAIDKGGDRAAEKLMNGVRNSLTNEETKKKLADLERVLVAGLRDPLTSQETLAKIRGLELEVLSDLREQLKETERELLDHEFEAALGRAREQLIGPKALDNVKQLRDAMIGEETRAALVRLVDEAMGDAMQARVGTLREEFIGEKARAAIDTLIRDSFHNIGTQFDLEIKPRLQTEEAKIQSRLHVVIAVAAAAVSLLLILAWLLFRRGKRYRSLIDVLTVTIDSMPNTAAYDGVTHEVSREAKLKGLEPTLRQILIEQGINDQEPSLDRAA